MNLLEIIWNNLFTRFIIIISIIFISFSIIFQKSDSIFRNLSKLFQTMKFDDISSHTSKPYGFSENKKKAQKLFLSGLFELAKVSENLYKWESNDLIENNKLSKTGLRLVYMLLEELTLICDGRYSKSSYPTLKDNNLRLSGSPITYAKYLDYQLKTEQIYIDKIAEALQIKPDLIPALKWSEEISNAICKPKLAATNWQRALTYFEYKTESKLFHAQPKQNPDLIFINSQKVLKYNSHYYFLLKNYFKRASKATERVSDWQINKALNIFYRNPKIKTVEPLLSLALRQLQFSNVAKAKEIFLLLYELNYNGFATHFKYLYTLAEAAWRAHLPKKSIALINTIRSENLAQSKTETRKINRLALILTHSQANDIP